MNLSIAAKLGLPALALVAALAACTDPVVPVTKTTFTVSPADKATGVLETSKVVLTYNAAMADSAKTSVTLKDGATVVPSTPVWDTAKKVLTVTPTSALGFSKVISVVVAAAKDAAGGDVDPKTTTFTVKAGPIGGTTKSFVSTNDGNIAGDYPVVNTAASVLTTFAFNATSPSVPGTLAVGNIFDGVSRGAVRFTLAGVTPAQITKATLNLDIPAANVVGTPLTTLGGLQIKGVNFGTDIAADGVDAKADFQTGDAGATDVTVSASSKVSVDVTAFVKTLVANGNADFIIRFKTEPATKGAYTAGQSLRISALESTTAANRPTLEIVTP
jgi:Bacterial Ig-like domain